MLKVKSISRVGLELLQLLDGPRSSTFKNKEEKEEEVGEEVGGEVGEEVEEARWKY